MSNKSITITMENLTGAEVAAWIDDMLAAAAAADAKPQPIRATLSPAEEIISHRNTTIHLLAQKIASADSCDECPLQKCEAFTSMEKCTSLIEDWAMAKAAEMLKEDSDG